MGLDEQAEELKQFNERRVSYVSVLVHLRRRLPTFGCKEDSVAGNSIVRVTTIKESPLHY